MLVELTFDLLPWCFSVLIDTKKGTLSILIPGSAGGSFKDALDAVNIDLEQASQFLVDRVDPVCCHVLVYLVLRIQRDPNVDLSLGDFDTGQNCV